MSDKLPLAIQKAVRQYAPIQSDGLIFYPVLVEEIDEYLTAQPALTAMQQAFPVRYVSMPLLSAYYGMEYEAQIKGEESEGLFFRALLILALSLRLGQGRDVMERVRLFKLIVDPQHPERLKSLKFQFNGEEICEITPIAFQRIRPIIAAQNGAELISEDANPDLVQAENDLADIKSPKLDVKIDNIIDTLSLVTGKDESEILQWPVAKLFRMRSALERMTEHVMCGIAEGGGASWKKGNPYPSLFFDRAKDETVGLMPLESFANGAGVGAIQNNTAADGQAPDLAAIAKGVKDFDNFYR